MSGYLIESSANMTRPPGVTVFHSRAMGKAERKVEAYRLRSGKTWTDGWIVDETRPQESSMIPSTGANVSVPSL